MVIEKGYDILEILLFMIIWWELEIIVLIEVRCKEICIKWFNSYIECKKYFLEVESRIYSIEEEEEVNFLNLYLYGIISLWYGFNL